MLYQYDESNGLPEQFSQFQHPQTSPPTYTDMMNISQNPEFPSSSPYTNGSYPPTSQMYCNNSMANHLPELPPDMINEVGVCNMVGGRTTLIELFHF